MNNYWLNNVDVTSEFATEVSPITMVNYCGPSVIEIKTPKLNPHSEQEAIQIPPLCCSEIGYIHVTQGEQWPN